MALLKLTQLGAREDELLEFLAISSSKEHDSEGLQTLSPRTMSWTPSIDLLDMRACRAFWLQMAQHKQQDLSLLLKSELEKILGTKDFTLAAASTPGEALLVLKAAEEKGFQGIIHAESRLGQNLIKGLTWEAWWEIYEDYAHKKEIHSSLANKSRHAMHLAMQRLGCKTPDQLRNLPSSHIQRRFGKFASEVWQLSFPKRQGLKSNDAIELFPWHRFEAKKRSFVTRHLDHSLRDWSVIEELLREDLNRLSVLSSFKKEERILKLEWRIVLCDLQEIPVIILFRHPHSLHQDCPSQRTALLQIQYTFERNAKIRAASQESGLISWQLEIAEKAPARLRQATLFQESSDNLHTLKSLENMLKKPLEAYGLETDWLAEDSFHLSSSEREHSSTEKDLAKDIHLSLNRKRPLFLFQKPEALPLPFLKESRFGAFQERTMDKWWKVKTANSSRDYYQLFHKETLLWVYRDQGGTWHTHGVYG